MASNLITTILVIITGLILIALMLLIYWRSRQGEQRVTTLINQMLLPMLSAIVITAGLLFAKRSPLPSCTRTFDILPYIGLFGTLLLIAIGLVRFFASSIRDRRLITHPIIFAVILMAIVFMLELLRGCL